MSTTDYVCQTTWPWRIQTNNICYGLFSQPISFYYEPKNKPRRRPTWRENPPDQQREKEFLSHEWAPPASPFNHIKCSGSQLSWGIHSFLSRQGTKLAEVAGGQAGYTEREKGSLPHQNGLIPESQPLPQPLYTSAKGLLSATWNAMIGRKSHFLSATSAGICQPVADTLAESTTL